MKVHRVPIVKMETAIRAERGGTVGEVLVGPGDRVEAKDLLVVLAEG